MIVCEVLKCIINKFLEIAIPPLSKEQLENVSERFYERWNYPNAVGAMDGKLVKITAPPNSGSEFFNFKNFFSVNLFALVDADYKFLVIDVGSAGREGDAGIFQKSELGKSISNNSFPWPDPKALPNTANVLPCVILGDEAFGLTPHIMRPFPRERNSYNYAKSCFNYRHSRARRIIENVFGQVTQTNQVFFKPMNLDIENIENLIIVCCILHNLMKDELMDNNKDLEDKVVLPKDWHALEEISEVGEELAMEGNFVRNTFAAYFVSPLGSVAWQRERVTRTE